MARSALTTKTAALLPILSNDHLLFPNHFEHLTICHIFWHRERRPPKAESRYCSQDETFVETDILPLFDTRDIDVCFLLFKPTFMEPLASAKAAIFHLSPIFITAKPFRCIAKGGFQEKPVFFCQALHDETHLPRMKET